MVAGLSTSLGAGKRQLCFSRQPDRKSTRLNSSHSVRGALPIYRCGVGRFRQHKARALGYGCRPIHLARCGKKAAMLFKAAVAAAAALCLAVACRPRGPEGGDDARVDALLSRMTLDEKIQLLHGAPEPAQSNQGEAGYLPGIARLGIAPLRFADGPPGVLTRYPATGLTASMGLAATFSRDDARATGTVIARDAKALGIDLVLEPFI